MEQIVQLNSKANLSQHFVLGEFTRSKYPEVYNIPSHEAIANMKRLCVWLAILIAYATESNQEFDELLIEKNRYGAIWVHFAVRPKDNRHKALFINA